MIRATPHLDDNTSTYARTCPGFGKTAAQMALAIEVCRTPLHKRALWALCRYGWMLVVVALAAVVLTGCSGDMRHEQAAAKELLAIQQEEAAQASRDFVARQVCGEARAQWISDKTLYCEPRRGKAYKASVQVP